MKIVLVVLDTLRKDAIAPYDDAIAHTPNLAAFADEATVYDNAVAQAPWSLPSQTSILTGRYPWQHGAGQCQPYLGPDEPVLQVRLQQAGFHTAAIHENTWLVPGTGTMRGFDEVATPADGTRHFAGLWRAVHDLPGGAALARKLVLALSDHHRRSTPGEHTDSTALLDRTRQFLSAHAREDFFLHLNPANAHYPYAPPRAYAEAHGADRSCTDLESRPLEYGGRAVPGEEDSLRRLYAGEVDYLDDVFGRLVALFEAAGVYEDTHFVVLADHGELLGEDGIVGHHFSVRPELTDVPLLVRRPGGSGGREASVTELREVYYWLLEAADVPATDDERLLADRAAGLYETPRIYRGRLPADRADLAVPRFYHVGADDRETSVELGRRIQGDTGELNRDAGPATVLDPDAGGVPDPE